MTKPRLYHNPNCSKSRGALEILTGRNVEIDVIEYLKTPLDEAALREIIDLIQDPPAELVRKDNHFKELGLNESDYTTTGAVVSLLAEHPKLMQRPIFIKDGHAVIGRPSERVEDLL